MSESQNFQFIWRNDFQAPAANTWTYFRRNFLWQPQMGTSIRVAADPTARLWVNGVLVLDRTQRFVTPYIPLETLDLGGLLQQGSNVIVVLHHWWGVPTFQRSRGGQPGIMLSGAGADSGEGWEWCAAAEHIHHTNQTIGHDGAARIRFPLLLDLRRESSSLHSAGCGSPEWQPVRLVRSEAWANPICKETPPLGRENVSPLCIVNFGRIDWPAEVQTALYEVGRRMRESTHLADSAALRGVVPGGLWSQQLMAGVSGGYVCVDFGKPVHGYLALEVLSAAAGTVLEFGYCELEQNPIDGSAIISSSGAFDPEFTVGTPFGDHVILSNGPQRVELPEERTWRWLLIHWQKPEQAAGELVFGELSCHTSQHPVTQHGSFDAQDETLKGLVDLCLDHARITMSDAYVDTTGREDAQWLEDIQFRARLAANWFGDASLRQVTLRHAVEQQDFNTGLFRVFSPEDYSSAGCQFQDWGMAWVGMLYDDWQWTGETCRIEAHFFALQTFLDALHSSTNSDGLLSGDNTLGDLRTSLHADYAAGGIDSIPNAWYYGYLRQAAQMAQAVGQMDSCIEWDLRAKRVFEGFKCFLTRLPECGELTVAETWSAVSGPDGYGQAAVVSAVFHGLLDGESANAVLAAVFPPLDGTPPTGVKRWNTPTYIYRALRCLCEYGLGDIARAHLFAVYEPYLPDGPLPEYFLAGECQPIDPTGSHGWGAVPLAWLHDTVLGVRRQVDAQSGTGKTLIAPCYAGWSHVSGTVCTEEGPLHVTVDWDARRLSIRWGNGDERVTDLPGVVSFDAVCG